MYDRLAKISQTLMQKGDYEILLSTTNSTDSLISPTFGFNNHCENEQKISSFFKDLAVSIFRFWKPDMLICMLILLIQAQELYAQAAYVGESIYLPAPSVPGTIGGAAWYAKDNSDCVSISGNHYGATVSINAYFSGITTIACKYAYSYYIGSKKQYGNGTKYYSISCKASQVTLNKTEIVLKPGQEYELTYTNQSGFTLPHAYWSTSNNAIANFNGREWIAGQQQVTITAVDVGESVITCEGHVGTAAPSCIVKVQATPPTNLSLTPERLTLQEGKCDRFSYTLYPSDAYAKVSWSSSDESISKIDSNGLVTAICEGEAQILATTDNGLSTCGIVEVIPQPRQISLPNTLQMTIGYTIRLEPVLTPDNALTTYKWESADPRVAIIDDAGNVKGKSSGTTTISVTTANGKTASCHVTIKEPSEGMDYRNTGVRITTLQNQIGE